MAASSDFLEPLLAEGTIRLTVRPQLDAGNRADAVKLLARAFAGYRLSIAGPLIEFDSASALAAAELVWLAGWFLLVREEEPDEVERALQLVPPVIQPSSGGSSPGRLASRHLSADLTLRYLPQIHQRARSIAADDVLTRSLARTLRHWPLAGVLADLHEPPLLSIEELDHPGLLLLYAERLPGNPPARVAAQGGSGSAMGRARG